MTIKPNLEVLDSGTGSEGVRSFHEPSGARHSFKPSPNPRAAGSCVKCGRVEADSIHEFLDLAHRASVTAHLELAANAARSGDLTGARLQALVAVRLIDEED